MGLPGNFYYLRSDIQTESQPAEAAGGMDDVVEIVSVDQKAAVMSNAEEVK